MKVLVDYDLCEGNAGCMEEAPEVFKVDDSDNIHILIENPGEEHREKIERAVKFCPRAALKIE